MRGRPWNDVAGIRAGRLDGSVETGPATAPLRRYVATLDTSGITVASG